MLKASCQNAGEVPGLGANAGLVPLQGGTVTARGGTCGGPSLPHADMTDSCCWPQPTPLYQVYESYMSMRQDVLSKDGSLKVSLGEGGGSLMAPQ